jgi:uncharacterized protein YdeI (YjbR/CyaY-like superfamily)
MITAAGIAVPEDMAAALADNPSALSTFQSLGSEDQRGYVNWLAKPGATTRRERLEQMADHVLNHKRRAAPVE